MRYYTYEEVRRGAVQGRHADDDEPRGIIGSIIASPERRGYVALAGFTVTAICVFYALAYAVCRSRGWM